MREQERKRKEIQKKAMKGISEYLAKIGAKDVEFIVKVDDGYNIKVEIKETQPTQFNK